MAENSRPREGGVETPELEGPDDLTRRNVRTIADLEAAENAQRTSGDRMADTIAAFCGSMPFVWVHAAWFAFWVAINVMPGWKHVDPFPFQLLTLVTSLEAIFLTTFVMISQNHQGRLADRRNHLDLQVNLLAEQENSKMLSMLKVMMEHMGISQNDAELAALAETTRPEILVEQIQETIENIEDTEAAAA